MHLWFSLLPLLLPALPLAAALGCRFLSGANAARLAVAAAGMAFVCAGSAAVVLIFAGPQQIGWVPANAPVLALILRWELLGAVMAVLVSFLGWVVLRFSGTCLAGDPAQARFLSWMSLTLASVLTLVLAGSLGLILGAWIATSLSLHRLLLHHPERAGAVFSARKKFVVSRLGDLCLLGALGLLYRHYGTTELAALFASAAAGNTGPLPAAGFLLAACAALKSAQFPFHSWLPDTMETPTPVSAFMHAGIVNAGGFLLLRLSPLMVHAPGALVALGVAGTVTAAFGAVVMLTQPSVKRALAYSTIAQMGFMILQCGLGAFGLALLHLVSHSLYKAHAFLGAGSTVGAVPRAAIPLRTPSLVGGALGAGLLVAGAAMLAHAWLPSAVPPPGVFGLVLALALAYGLARAWSAGGGPSTWVGAVGASVAVALAGLGLHGVATALGGFFPAFAPPPALVALSAAVFTGLFLFQALLWRMAHHRVGRRFYVHALNGFYVGTHANRLLARLWPRPAAN